MLKKSTICAVLLLFYLGYLQGTNNQDFFRISGPNFQQKRLSFNDISHNIAKVFSKKIDYVYDRLNYFGTENGIEDIFDCTVTGIAAVVGFSVYMYGIYKFQEYLINQTIKSHGMEIFLPGMIKVTLADVAGAAGAKEDMQDILNFLKNREKYTKNGAKIPKGILMNGAPGNGKTMLARALAGEVNCPFISMSGASFSDMFIGSGAKKVKMLFDKARELASTYGACIIFIDEIDAVAAKRGAINVHSEYDHILNALLYEMDGLVPARNPLVVIGATNRKDALDEAIVRPGRFDRVVEIGNLILHDRVELITLALQHKQVNADVNIEEIARCTEGFSGAELTNLINEALIIAGRDERQELIMNDIYQAYDNIVLGREVTTRELSAENLWQTAIHEAGHALATLYLDTMHKVHKVSIASRSKTLGVMHKIPLHESYNRTKEDMEHDICIALAGRLAEELFGMSTNTGAYSDLQVVRKLAYQMVVMYGMVDELKNISYDRGHTLPEVVASKVEAEIKKIIDMCTAQTQELLALHKGEIEKIAHELIQHKTILGNRVYEIAQVPAPAFGA